MKDKRYFLSVVEEGIMNPKFFGFRGGRIELHDNVSKSEYPIQEYRFLIPEDLIEKFRDMLDFYRSNLPIRIEMNMFNLEDEHNKYYGEDK